MRTYIKRPLEIQEQIEILKERRLIFLNEESATNKLKQISYFRLANYWKPMEQDKILHTFKPQSTPRLSTTWSFLVCRQSFIFQSYYFQQMLGKSTQ